MYEFTTENSFENGENIKIAKLLANHNVTRHTHNFVELVYIYSGEGTQEIDCKTYHVKKGDLLFINFGQSHSISMSDMEFVHILLKPEFMSENLINSRDIFEIFALSQFDSIDGEYN